MPIRLKGSRRLLIVFPLIINIFWSGDKFTRFLSAFFIIIFNFVLFLPHLLKFLNNLIIAVRLFSISTRIGILAIKNVSFITFTHQIKNFKCKPEKIILKLLI